MSRLSHAFDGRNRLLAGAAAAIALFALIWWGASALGLIEAGSSGGDGGVIVEPLPTDTPAARIARASTPRPTPSPTPISEAFEPTQESVAPADEATPLPTSEDETPTVPPAPEPSSTPEPPPPPPPPPPVATGSLAGVRVWSNGDSTSFFMSVSFLNQAANAGAVQTQPEPEYQISSGLLRPEFFDWPAYLAAEMASRDPDVVVFMIGANDAYVGMPLDTYRQRVAAVMDQLGDRRVIWVGQPNMGRADLAAAIPPMNQVYAQEAASRPWVTYIDAWALTSDASGAYAQYLPDETGTLRQIRADDGVHLTAEGGRRLANAVMAAAGG